MISPDTWKVTFRTADGRLMEDTNKGCTSLSEVQREFEQAYPDCVLLGCVSEEMQFNFANRPEEGWEGLNDDNEPVPKKGQGREYGLQGSAGNDGRGQQKDGGPRARFFDDGGPGNPEDEHPAKIEYDYDPGNRVGSDARLRADAELGQGQDTSGGTGTNMALGGRRKSGGPQGTFYIDDKVLGGAKPMQSAADVPEAQELGFEDYDKPANIKRAYPNLL